MYVKSIYAKQFRNILDENIEFENGINVLYGKNASGKTNVLEAIYLFASGKSLRLSPEKDFITRDKDFARISLEYVNEITGNTDKSMSITYLPGNKKIMRYGGFDVLRMSAFLGHFRACVFTPDDLSLVKGSPEERRRFIDISISQISPRFVHCLNDYARVLSQKNMLLKKAHILGKVDETYLAVLNEKLSEAASIIVRQRNGFCENLYRYAGDIYREISGEKENFAMRYVSQSKKKYHDEEYTKNAYLELYERSKESEIRNGVTLVGPHRDDINFYVGKDEEYIQKSVEKEQKEEKTDAENLLLGNHTAKAFGSRGQQRSVVLSLKLAQGELFRELCGEYPVFLLDDVFSELDSVRREYILSKTKGRQVIITCCDCDILGSFKGYNAIYAENGRYTRK